MYIHVAIILSSVDRDSFAVGWRGAPGKMERQWRAMKEEQADVDEAG